MENLPLGGQYPVPCVSKQQAQRKKWQTSDSGANFFKKIDVLLIYNVVLVLGVQQSDSVIHMHMYSFSHSFPSWFTTGF